MHLLLSFVTEFGDQGVVLPFTAIVGIAIAAGGARREALIWYGAIGAALIGTLAAKFIFLPCGHLFPSFAIRSPSGHTAGAIAAYGGFAVLWAKLAQDRRLGSAFIAASVIACLAIAISRVLIGVHTASEVLFGGLLGLIAPAILIGIEPPQSRPVPRPTLLLLLVPLTLALLLNGRSLPVEGLIKNLSMQLSAWIGICA